MKRLQLPKNKLARLAINIAFIVIWPLVANQIKWVLNGISFVPYIYHYWFAMFIVKNIARSS